MSEKREFRGIAYGGRGRGKEFLILSDDPVSTEIAALEICPDVDPAFSFGQGAGPAPMFELGEQRRLRTKTCTQGPLLIGGFTINSACAPHFVFCGVYCGDETNQIASGEPLPAEIFSEIAFGAELTICAIQDDKWLELDVRRVT